jgi:hypothetical protein
MRFLASDDPAFHESALAGLGEDPVSTQVAARLRNSDGWGSEVDALLAALAHLDLVAALRLRMWIAAWRVDAETTQEAPDSDRLLEEIGTGLTLALRLDDAFAFVGLARRHCRLLGTITLDEIRTVLDHACTLAGAMAAEDARFSPVAGELSAESSQFEDKILVDLTKLLPADQID